MMTFFAVLLATAGKSSFTQAQPVVTWDQRGGTFVDAYSIDRQLVISYGGTATIGERIHFRVSFFCRSDGRQRARRVQCGRGAGQK